MALQKDYPIRIGVDLGGTKTEFVALEPDGTELHLSCWRWEPPVALEALEQPA